MTDEKRAEVIRIDHTAGQRERVKTTERTPDVAELTVQELEERITPRKVL